MVIENRDCRVVVFVDGSRLSLSVSRFMKNETQMLHDFCCSVYGNKFGALCTDRLCARVTSHNTTAQATSVARRRATLTQFIGVCCINMSNQLSEM